MRTVMKRLFLLATVLLATVAVAPTEEARGQETQPGQLSKPPLGIAVPPTKPPLGIAVPPTKPPSRSVVQPTPGRKIERVPFKKGGATAAVAGQCPADCSRPGKRGGQVWCAGNPTGCGAAGAGCGCNLYSLPKPPKPKPGAPPLPPPTEDPKWFKEPVSQGNKWLEDPDRIYQCWCTK
jgi:hypothetical protein